MVDGAGLPLNAADLLPTLVKLTKKVTEQVRLLAKDEDEKLAETTSYDVIPPYDQARALGKTNIDVDRIAAGLPCGSEGFLLMYARWRKVERDLYNERKEYDITQIPDVYDSCKYDLLHTLQERKCVLGPVLAPPSPKTATRPPQPPKSATLSYIPKLPSFKLVSITGIFAEFKSIAGHRSHLFVSLNLLPLPPLLSHVVAAHNIPISLVFFYHGMMVFKGWCTSQ
ncbi:unnamed protein product [Lactuca virosa]|uniref:Inositol hexakisphosphate and diphosphoinositol-pentakisphosphate kinase n=1 Tax=Lactuca virosa TaxID=75947 RepID=A0AAU9NTD6_9ASTR|nr:unnamed protein product [Lactuca virosa]